MWKSLIIKTESMTKAVWLIKKYHTGQGRKETFPLGVQFMESVYELLMYINKLKKQQEGHEGLARSP